MKKKDPYYEDRRRLRDLNDKIQKYKPLPKNKVTRRLKKSKLVKTEFPELDKVFQNKLQREKNKKILQNM